MELSAIIAVLEELRLWVKAATEWSSSNKKAESAALDSLLLALNETMIYLGRINSSPESAYRETEEKISRLWKSAALQVQPYNRELSKRCNAKRVVLG